MADEAAIVDRWFTATLGARTQLTALLQLGAASIHNTEAPTGDAGATPHVLFTFMGGADVRGNGPHRIMTNGLWLVKGVVETRDFLAVEPIANEIEVAIEAGDGTAEDGFVFSCVREQPFRLAERDNGHDYRHVGGIFRVLAQRPPVP